MLAEIEEFLVRGLKLYHYPVGIRFLFEEAALQQADCDKICSRRLTFCQYVAFVRQAGQATKLGRDSISCRTANDLLGLAPDETACIDSLVRVLNDRPAAAALYSSRPRFAPGELAGVSLGPLSSFEAAPDLVLIVCDNLQAVHLLDDYLRAHHCSSVPFQHQPNGAFCATAVASFLTGTPQIALGCPGANTAGKMERGELVAVMPFGQLAAACEAARKRAAVSGSFSLLAGSRDFAGLDVCGNCPLIKFDDYHSQ